MRLAFGGDGHAQSAKLLSFSLELTGSRRTLFEKLACDAVQLEIEGVVLGDEPQKLGRYFLRLRAREVHMPTVVRHDPDPELPTQK